MAKYSTEATRGDLENAIVRISETDGDGASDARRTPQLHPDRTSDESDTGSVSKHDIKSDKPPEESTITTTQPEPNTPDTDTSTDTDGDDDDDGGDPDFDPEHVERVFNAIKDTQLGHQRCLFAAHILDTTRKPFVREVIGYSESFYYQMVGAVDGLGVLEDDPQEAGRLTAPIMDVIAPKMWASYDVETDIYARPRAIVPADDEHPGYRDGALESIGISPEDLLTISDIPIAENETKPETETDPKPADDTETKDELVSPEKRYECEICRRVDGEFATTSSTIADIRAHITGSEDRHHRGRSGTEAGLVRQHPTDDEPLNEPRTEGTETTTGIEDVLSAPESADTVAGSDSTQPDETADVVPEGEQDRVDLKLSSGTYRGSAMGLDARTRPVQTIGDRPIKGSKPAIGDGGVIADGPSGTGSDDTPQTQKPIGPLSDTDERTELAAWDDVVDVQMSYETVYEIISGRVSPETKRSLFAQLLELGEIPHTEHGTVADDTHHSD